MYSIINTTSEYIINKSRFITKLYMMNDINIDNILNEIKNEYKNATHYCYAYIIDNIEKAYDDGEPTSTAGLPILNVLKKNNLNHVLCVVIRYFGGIKLGSGGLIRAYSNSVIKAINESEIIELIESYKVRIQFNYNDTNEINSICNKYKIIYKEFDEEVIYELYIPISDYEYFKHYKVEILEKGLIKKES